MSTCAVVKSVIESKMSEVQTSNVGFTSEVSDYLVVHTGPVVLSRGSTLIDLDQPDRPVRHKLPTQQRLLVLALVVGC